MTDEVKFVLQIALNLAAVLLAGWLAGRYAARQVQKVLAMERQRAQAALQQAQAEVVASLPPLAPELEQLTEIECWVLAARNLQLVLTSLGTLVRIRLRADTPAQSGVVSEIDRSASFLGRQEHKWLNASLTVVTNARQLDPAKGKTQDQSLESWLSRLNQAYVQASQSLRRAVSLCDPQSDVTYGDTLANTYLTEADQATATMASLIGSALDRIASLKQQLPQYQVQQIAAAVAERADGAWEIWSVGSMNGEAEDAVSPAVTLVTSAKT